MAALELILLLNFKHDTFKVRSNRMFQDHQSIAELQAWLDCNPDLGPLLRYASGLSHEDFQSLVRLMIEVRYDFDQKILGGLK